MVTCTYHSVAVWSACADAMNGRIASSGKWVASRTEVYTAVHMLVNDRM